MCFRELKNLVKLKISLSYGKLRDEGVIEVTEGLSFCHNLEYFDIDITSDFISSIGIRALGISLSNLQKLKTLTLSTSSNDFKNETSFKSFVEGFLRMKESLIELEWNLKRCKITDYGFENITLAIS